MKSLNKIMAGLMALSVAVALSGCGDDSAKDEPKNVDPAEPENPKVEDVVKAAPLSVSYEQRDIVEAHNVFASKFLAAAMAQDETNSNVAVSPLSAEVCLSMVANAATGDTRAQLLKVLGYNDLDKLNEFNAYLLKGLPAVDPSLVKMSLANSVWSNAERYVTMVPAYKNALSDYYQAESYEIGFLRDKAKDKINSWCLDNTNGLIKDFIKDEKELENGVQVLLNAMYFNGVWAKDNSFDASKTAKASFTNADGSKAKVDMMALTDEVAGYQGNDFNAAKLDYGQGTYSMVIVQPTGNKSLEECVAEVAANSFFGKDFATVKMPRFEAETSTNMNKLLESMGVKMNGCSMENILRNGEPMAVADLTVKQKAIIKVTEKGTEAAAVTGGFIAESAGPGSQPKHFAMTLDRPFGYVIVESGSNAVVMMGAVRKM